MLRAAAKNWAGAKGANAGPVQQNRDPKKKSKAGMAGGLGPRSKSGGKTRIFVTDVDTKKNLKKGDRDRGGGWIKGPQTEKE